MPTGPRTAERPMSYGTAQKPVFSGPGEVIQTARLAREYIPTRSNKKRLIAVGDVHGMLEPLKELLKKVDFDPVSGNDHVVLVGDMVNKGPDSAAVIDYAMEIGASAVRGNHEDRVLLAHAALHSRKVIDQDDQEGEDADADAYGADGKGTATDTLEQIHFSHGDQEDRSTARALKHRHIEWLSQLPVILEAGRVEGLHKLVFVHAGLVPGLSLEDQSPWAAMNMRTLVYPREQLRREDAKGRVDEYVRQREGGPPRGGRPVTTRQRAALVEAEVERTARPSDRDVAVPVHGRDGDPWAGVWNRWQDARVDDAHRMTVVYGHDAQAGLSVGPYTFGLDTGCVYGRELTALVIEGTGEGVKHEVVQVECRKARTMDEGDKA
jgi:bis(5'-nucleosyl)-tetraphosphatase (symmetrical)